MHLAHFMAYLSRQLTRVEAGAGGRLVGAPWQRLAEQVAGSLPNVPIERGALLVSWDHSGAGGVWLDADRQERPFADGPVDPQPLLDGSEFFQSTFGLAPDALPGELVSITVECLTFLCAEVLVQHVDRLGPQAQVLAVQAGHDETPRVVFRRATLSGSIFDDQGAFLLPTDEELLERSPSDGHALAKLVETLGSGSDGMKLLGKLDAVFLRVARGERSPEARAEVRALVAALATHHRRLSLPGWGELYEQVMAKALVCAVGDRETFGLVLEALMPADDITFDGLAFNLACLHALFGDRDEALVAIDRALQLGLEPERFDDPDFDSLRDDPDFIALLGAPPEEGLTARLAEAVDELDVAKVEALIEAGADVNGEH